jgi:hypothetical protein
MATVTAMAGQPRPSVFERIADAAGAAPKLAGSRSAGVASVPYLTEGWYCCAEPGPELIGQL